jgi:Flp pilus assembly pilin Flp
MNIAKFFLEDNSGAVAMEYALLLSFLILGVIATVAYLGSAINNRILGAGRIFE